MSSETDLADAIVAALNAHTFTGVRFTARRDNAPLNSLSKIDKLEVIVAPRSDASERLSRGGDSSGFQTKHTFATEIGIQQRIGQPPPVSKQDVLSQFTQDVSDLFWSEANEEILPGFFRVGVATIQNCNADALRQKGVYIRIIPLVYETAR
jgi:hypothetical protein